MGSLWPGSLGAAGLDEVAQPEAISGFSPPPPPLLKTEKWGMSSCRGASFSSWGLFGGGIHPNSPHPHCFLFSVSGALFLGDLPKENLSAYPQLTAQN